MSARAFWAQQDAAQARREGLACGHDVEGVWCDDCEHCLADMRAHPVEDDGNPGGEDRPGGGEGVP